MALQTGEMLQNRYRIVSHLGQGGMGAVYRAWDNRLEISVAIKEMTPQMGLDPQMLAQLRQQFQQEATVLAHLAHPHLVRVTDFFEERGNWYLVMDYVEGETLEDYLNRSPGGRVPLEEALRIVRQLLNVLEYLHKQNPPVIFRDMKPSNVMLTPGGEIKLIDFGIARFFKPGQTRDTMLLGTPGYAAPEQYGGLGQCDARSDVYGLGVLLHQMVSGRDPVRAVTPFPLPPVSSLVRGLPRHVEEAITRATQVQPDLRFRDAAEFRQALFPPTRLLPPRQGASAQPYTSTAPPTQILAAPWLGKGLGIGIGIAAVLLVGLCIALALAVPGLINPRETPTPSSVVSSSPGTDTPTSVPAQVSPTPSPRGGALPAPTVTPVPSPPPFRSLSWTNIGRSVEGRSISVGSVGYEGEVAVLIVGSIQGDQSGTRDLVNELAEYFDAHHDQVPGEVMFYLLPSLNPDGNAAGSRFNANGVDLNRNWETRDWRYDPEVPGYPNGLPGAGGSAPMSEPETRALRDYVYELESRFEVRIVVVHSSVHRTEGEVYPGGSNSVGMANAYSASTNYEVEHSWAEYVTSGELVTWGEEQGLLSIDIVFPASQRPNSQVPGTGRTLTELTVRGLVAIATLP